VVSMGTTLGSPRAGRLKICANLAGAPTLGP